MADGDDAASRLAKQPEVLLRDVELAVGIGFPGRDHRAGGVGNLLQQSRLPERPAVRDRCVGVEKLQRRDRDEALPDGLLVGVADRPWLIEVRELPLRIGHDPRGLAWKVDPGRGSETEHAPVFRDRVRPDAADIRRHRAAAGQRVEVDVARVRESGDEVERPMRAPIEERGPADAERARRNVDDRVPRRGPLRQRREPGHELEGRARRIDLPHRLVDERMTIIGVQRGQILAGDASREEVVVVARD